MSIFHFKEFSINQLDASMKVGTDAMLIGSLINADGKENGLDIGTGTGVLALMVAQKNQHLNIKAVDIDATNICLATDNFKKSKYHSQLKSKLIDFLDFDQNIKFDLIFSNPPYYEDGLENKDKRKANARHEQALPIEKLIQRAKNLLSENGDLWLILPSINKIKWISFSEKIGFHLFQSFRIQGKEGIDNRVVLNLSVNKRAFQNEQTIIIRDSENNYTKQYKALTKDYHGVKI
jgi:tRNA1Val (adenine37-N6)-methyltransferase